MRIETKLIKQILKTEIPEGRFNVKTIKPVSYVNSSDKIIIETIYRAGYTIEDIIKIIEKYIRKIAIGQFGTYLSMSGSYDSQILDISNNKWEEVEAEFILIKS